MKTIKKLVRFAKREKDLLLLICVAIGSFLLGINSLGYILTFLSLSIIIVGWPRK